MPPLSENRNGDEIEAARLTLFFLREIVALGSAVQAYRLNGHLVRHERDIVEAIADLPKPVSCTATREGATLSILCDTRLTHEQAALLGRQLDAADRRQGAWAILRDDAPVAEYEFGSRLRSVVITRGAARVWLRDYFIDLPFALTTAPPGGGTERARLDVHTLRS
jgi:hypothetical protein